MKLFLALAVTPLVIYVLHRLWLKLSRRRFPAQSELPAGGAFRVSDLGGDGGSSDSGSGDCGGGSSCGDDGGGGDGGGD